MKDRVQIFVFLFFSSLLLRWINSVVLNGWNLEESFTIVMVVVFLAVSFLMETKTNFSIYDKWFLYFSYLFLIDSIGSFGICNNPCTVKYIFITMSLSVVVSSIWTLVMRKAGKLYG